MLLVEKLLRSTGELILFEAGVPYSNTLDCGCGDGAAATPELRPIELLAADDGDPCNPLLHTPTRMKELRRTMIRRTQTPIHQSNQRCDRDR